MYRNTVQNPQEGVKGQILNPNVNKKVASPYTVCISKANALGMTVFILK